MSLQHDYDFSIREDAEVFLEQVLDGLETPAVVLSPQLVVRHWNRAMAGFTGRAAAAVIGDKLTDAVPALNTGWFYDLIGDAGTFGQARNFPQTAARELARALGESAASRAEEIDGARLLRVGSGVAYEGSLLLTLRLGRSGAAPPLERELDRARQALVANVSHQLRTPLNSMIGFVDLVRMGAYGALEARQSEMLEKALHSGRRMARTIDTMIRLSEIEMGAITARPEPTDLGTLIDEVHRSLLPQAAEHGVLLEVRHPADRRLVRIDGARVREVLLEVARNAIQFSPDGQSVQIDATADNDRALFTVSDHGIGVAESEQGRIFARYYTTAEAGETGQAGIGLGLTYAQACVKLLGGTIQLRSEPGRGTTVAISLPLA